MQRGNFLRRCLVAGLLVTLAYGPLAGGLARGEQANDNNPIVLKSLRLTPAAIDTSGGASQVTVSVTATDDISGITYFEASFADQGGSGRQSAFSKSPPQYSAVSLATVTFP